MAQAVRVFDKIPGCPRVAVQGLRIASRQVTAAELIRQRVTLAVDLVGLAVPASNAARDGHADEWLLDPARRTRVQNRGVVADLDAAVERALEAFRRGRIILLVDDRQIEALDAVFGLTDSAEITFLQLVPLVGG